MHTTQIHDLIRQGRKIDAIKLLRQTSGLNLEQAKDEIERLTEEIQAQPGSQPTHVPQSPSQVLTSEIVELALKGEKIKAIKLLRERTGMNLEKAKQQIDALTYREETGHSPILLILVIIALCVIVALSWNGM